MKGPIRIAIDIGGTFTDLQFLEESSGLTESHKTPTTPENPAIGLVSGIREAMSRLGFDNSQVSGLMHGTTIATNAILQRRFPRTALLTTAGFEDILEIGRHVRSDIYSQIAEGRPVLVDRYLRFGVNERVDAQGKVILGVQQQQVIDIAQVLRRMEVEAVAICLLNSFAFPDHEQSIANWLNEYLPGVKVTTSCTVSPEAREYERTSTTVLNALLIPVVSQYLDQLKEKLSEVGIHAPVYLVQSNGGVTTPEIAAEQPVRLILSGPSGGARAVEVIAERSRLPDLIAIDMGGTSFDVSVIRQNRANLQTQGEIDTIPVRVPMLEIRTIGAGGGSIATVDESGRLTVGPNSAGAEPGPVAYGRGGTEPTVTDANVALGRIDPDYFLGGSLSLNRQDAVASILNRVAEPLGLDVDRAASGIVDIAVSHMAAAIRLSLFEKGLDPQDFALVSFGGAGGLHAAMVANQLGARRILFPADAGTQSAWGMLFANVVHDVSQSCLCPVDDHSLAQISNTLVQLQRSAVTLLDRSGVPADRRSIEIGLDMRYPGQGWELTVPCAMRDIIPNLMGSDTIAQAVIDFHRLHLEQFAHQDLTVVPELVTLRLRATGKMTMPRPAAAEPASQLSRQYRSVFLDDQWQRLPIYKRQALSVNQSIDGPVIIEDPHSTIVLPAGWRVRFDNTGVLIAEVLDS